MNKGIVVFSGYDGISGAHIALDRVGIMVDLYLASELLMIEKKNGKLKFNPAVRITQFNYPDTVQLGDIRNINGYPLRGFVDLFTGGSPCQSFSNAGPRKGFDGKSGLFWEWVRLKNEILPEYWFFENVRMKKEWEDIISNALGIQPIHTNSSRVSGQNRPRSYWSNIPYTEINDKKILLGDVVLGAITGVSQHGKAIPEHLKIPGGYNYKNDGWKDNIKNKANCLTTSRGSYRNIQGDRKKFTPEDCEELQTFIKGYTNVPGVSDYERIQALGNSWTIDIIVEGFFKNLPWASEMKVEPITNFLKV